MITINIRESGEFDKKTATQYKEMIIEIGELKFNTGLLDRDEALLMVSELISAAEDLLPTSYDYAQEKLSQIRERL